MENIFWRQNVFHQNKNANIITKDAWPTTKTATGASLSTHCVCSMKHATIKYFEHASGKTPGRPKLCTPNTTACACQNKLKSNVYNQLECRHTYQYDMKQQNGHNQWRPKLNNDLSCILHQHTMYDQIDCCQIRQMITYNYLEIKKFVNYLINILYWTIMDRIQIYVLRIPNGELVLGMYTIILDDY